MGNPSEIHSVVAPWGKIQTSSQRVEQIRRRDAPRAVQSVQRARSELLPVLPLLTGRLDAEGMRSRLMAMRLTVSRRECWPILRSAK